MILREKDTDLTKARVECVFVDVRVLTVIEEREDKRKEKCE